MTVRSSRCTVCSPIGAKVYRTSGRRMGWSSSNSRWRNLDFRVFDHDPWSEPGGDFVSAASGDILVIGPGQYTWGSTAEMVDDVQMWVNSPAANFGWLLKDNEKRSRTTKRFDS